MFKAEPPRLAFSMGQARRYVGSGFGQELSYCSVVTRQEGRVVPQNIEAKNGMEYR